MAKSLLSSAQPILLAVIFVACSCSNVRQQKEAELAVLRQASSHSEVLLADLRAGRVPPASYDIHLFFSYNVVNDALQYLDDFSFPLPNDPSVTVTVGRIRLNSTGALPTATIAASAHKGDLVAGLDLELVLMTDAVSSDTARFRFKVLHSVPTIRWWQFELANSDLVKSLVSAELGRIAEKLPTLTVPLSKTITLGGPQKMTRQTLDTGRNNRGEPTSIDVFVTIPQTLHQGSLSITSYTFLASGLHVFGSVQP